MIALPAPPLFLLASAPSAPSGLVWAGAPLVWGGAGIDWR